MQVGRGTGSASLVYKRDVQWELSFDRKGPKPMKFFSIKPCGEILAVDYFIYIYCKTQQT